MRLSLFSRLVIGFLAVFGLVIGVGVYAIRELRHFDRITRSILERDNRVLDYEKKLADAHLSQVRYERKFFITKDQVLYREFLRFKRDFDRYLDEALAVADARAAPLLDEVKKAHLRYQALIEQQLRQGNPDPIYSPDWYKDQKDEISDQLLTSLEELKWGRHQFTLEKVAQLADAGERARQIAVAITLAALAFILIVSLVITRSVTRPIGLLKNKTREIAKGRFDGNLKISSPPEIAELAAAVNFMCRRLGELERVKSDFYAAMSHELRTPLTSIKEGTGLLLEGVGGATTERQKKLLTILAEESNRLIGLVNSLLDLSKMEAGMMNYNFRKGSVAPLIHKAVAEITPLVEAKQIRVETEVADPLPAVNMDTERILQVLRNLIGNAVKFTPKGGRVKVVAKAEDHRIAVSVRDTGPGIPAEDLKVIFEKFRQGRSNGGFSANGTGLGLAIAKHVVTSHQGEIWAENDPEQGSTFTFVLPC